MDRRTLIFITLSVLIIVAYQELVLKRLAPPPTPVEQMTRDDRLPEETQPQVDLQHPNVPPRDTAPPVTEPAAIEPPAVSPIEGRSIRIETDLYTAVLSTAGGRLESFSLNRYRANPEPGSPPLELVAGSTTSEPPMGIELRGARVWSDAQTLYESSAQDIHLTGAAERTVELTATIGGQSLVKKLTFRGNAYPIDLHVVIPSGEALPSDLSAPGPDGQPASVALTWSKMLHANQNPAAGIEGSAAFINGKLVHTQLSGLQKPEILTGQVSWAGFEDHYFLVAAAPERATALQLRPKDSVIESRILTPRAPSGSTDVDYTLFLGPKDLDALHAAGHDLERSLNLGWFGPISLLLLRVLDLSHRLTGNYGIDIIILTILVKLAFWPLTQKSFQSMRAMQKLQPEMTKIRERLKDDPKQMNTEIMELYRRHKVNPLGGCLPMVLQIPVFFGLYQLLANTIELRHAPFFLWIHDLAAPERLNLLGYGIPVLTILLGISMFVQQRMAPQAGDPTQQRIMMFMPVVFTYMFIGFPAGLTIYWLTNNVLTIAQQYFILRNVPT